ncbi:DUF1294 domain-containing protein [Proteiniclasticum ruminis]|uniref:Uncharacterized membrane protein YsdA, DUF1294 family n=1 Tax=Proteiniclasticum ruminis TaxID=398199 RepID=A0A1I4YQ24_9CLOT|nr:DUF1294 domain-containing protein [Proteiniclasticum ruminis]SFN39730.1 Uncharacterized membrane protein YsdA, DUF1294 family [Proteiniclasticum ruminis]
MLYLNVYMLLINTVGFYFMLFDKQSSRKSKRRIPEKVLFTFAFLGGSAGVFLGMLFFRHKTKHVMFTLLIPSLTAAQIIAYFFIRNYLV